MLNRIVCETFGALRHFRLDKGSREHPTMYKERRSAIQILTRRISTEKLANCIRMESRIHSIAQNYKKTNYMCNYSFLRGDNSNAIVYFSPVNRMLVNQFFYSEPLEQ